VCFSDWSYVPYYDNAVDCEDGKIAKGFSYHQGPVWCTTFFTVKLKQISPNSYYFKFDFLSSFSSLLVGCYINILSPSVGCDSYIYIIFSSKCEIRKFLALHTPARAQIKINELYNIKWKTNRNKPSIYLLQEWVWPIGYFLRAKLLFAKKLESSRPGILKETVLFIKTTLTRHYEEVMNSTWRSLPEVTNHNGEVRTGCHGNKNG